MGREGKVNAPPLHRILGLLGSENRLLVLQLLVDGPFTVGEVAKVLDLTQDRASHLIAELVTTRLVRKTRKGQRVEAAIDREEIMLFLSNLGESLYPGGVSVTPRSILDLDGQTLADALIAERVVVYGDELPEVKPTGVEGIVPPDPFIDGWAGLSADEIREVWERPYQDENGRGVDEVDREIQEQLDDEEEVIDAT